MTNLWVTCRVTKTVWFKWLTACCTCYRNALTLSGQLANLYASVIVKRLTKPSRIVSFHMGVSTSAFVHQNLKETLKWTKGETVSKKHYCAGRTAAGTFALFHSGFERLQCPQEIVLEAWSTIIVKWSPCRTNNITVLDNTQYSIRYVLYSLIEILITLCTIDCKSGNCLWHHSCAEQGVHSYFQYTFYTECFYCTQSQFSALYAQCFWYTFCVLQIMWIIMNVHGEIVWHCMWKNDNSSTFGKWWRALGMNKYTSDTLGVEPF